VSRGDGFDIADVDVGLLEDPKFRQLARAHAGEEELIARCAIAYVALVLASWEEGDRVTLEDAAPAWLTDLPTLAIALVEHRLVDVEARIPLASWEAWFTPASERREASRERWRKSARGRRGQRPPGGSEGRSGDDDPRGVRADTARSPHGVTRTVPSVPSVPTEPSSPSSPTELSPLRAAAVAAGGFAAKLAVRES
jgi:hypothetical protein